MNRDDDTSGLGEGQTTMGRGSSEADTLGTDLTCNPDSESAAYLQHDFETVDLAVRYRMERKLGSGGMGAVHLAFDTRLGRPVAIKQILQRKGIGGNLLRRFLDESKSMAKFNHPNIVQIYDCGHTKDGPFIVMEFVDGESLAARVTESPLPLQAVASIFERLCDALTRAHGLRIIHRDIKPANILLSEDGTPKLTDFGLARDTSKQSDVTGVGVVLGTPEYMPPEQHRGAHLVDERSDVWSLAAAMYFALTGRSPRVITLDDLQLEVRRMLAKALRDDPAERFQTSQEFKVALQQCARPQPQLPKAQRANSVADRCPACDAQNSPDTRYCVTCGTSLEGACLSCLAMMPLRHDICGQCGKRQSPLVADLESRLCELLENAQRALDDHDFSAAGEWIQRVRDLEHPRLPECRHRVRELEKRLTRALDDARRVAGARLNEALRLEASHHYQEAVATLERVPASLWNERLAKNAETIRAAIERIAGKQAECERLTSVISTSIKSGELGGLHPLVVRLNTLMPGRASVESLLQKLEKRHTLLIQRRETIQREASQFLEMGDFPAAVALLDQIDASVINSDVQRLRESAEQRESQFGSLLTSIRTDLANRSLDGLLDKVKSAIELKPRHAELQGLRGQLEQREVKASAKADQLFKDAKDAYRHAQFSQGVELLEQIPLKRRTEEAEQLLAESRELGDLRQSIVDAGGMSRYGQPKTAVDAGRLEWAIEHGNRYLTQLRTIGLADVQIDELVQSCQDAVVAHRSALASSALKRRVAVVLGLSLAAAACIYVVYAASSFIRSADQQAKLKDLIQRQQWDAALEIFPENPTALLGKADSLLLDDGIDPEVVMPLLGLVGRVDPGSAGLPRSLGSVYALRAIRQANARDLVAAEAALNEAIRLSPQGPRTTEAVEAVAGAWLAAAEDALAQRDSPAIRLACANASRFVDARPNANKFLAEAIMIEAADLLEGGRQEDGLTLLKEASDLDSEWVVTAINRPFHEALRRLFERAIQDQFHRSWSARNWPAFLDVNRQSKRLAIDTSTWWLSVVLKQPDSIATVPEDVLSQTPQDVVLGLPFESLKNFPASLILGLPPITNSIGMSFKILPGGEFVMGEDGEDSLNVAHPVSLTVPFALGRFEVTNEQWEKIMGEPPGTWKGSSHPVESVNWEDAARFCTKLSTLPAEQAAGRSYRLPTEAEWEYACRGGQNTRYSFGDDELQLDKFGWFKKNSGAKTHPVGQRLPNTFGLYDMHGNVWEWCSDWFAPYTIDAAIDPQGPEKRSLRVIRGGGYSDDAFACRAAERGGDLPAFRYQNLGFRAVMATAPRRSSP